VDATYTGQWREWMGHVLGSGVRGWDMYWAVACMDGICIGHWRAWMGYVMGSGVSGWDMYWAVAGVDGK